MKKPVRFDDSLPVFIALICDAWGDTAISENVFLRDATGRLTFVVLGDQYDGESRVALAERAAGELEAYVDAGGFAVATPDELFDDTLKDGDIGWKVRRQDRTIRWNRPCHRPPSCRGGLAADASLQNWMAPTDRVFKPKGRRRTLNRVVRFGCPSGR